MKSYSRSHLSDHTLLSILTTRLRQERALTAELLADLAEVDARRLYCPAGYPSMFAYCVQELRLSEDVAYKRIQAARVAREFPVIFMALADGRLHLTGVGMLAPHLRPENAEELLAAAAHKTKSEIETLLAQRFPRSETMALTVALPAAQLAPAQVETQETEPVGVHTRQLAPGQVRPSAKLGPVAPERFLLQLTIGRSTQDKLRYAQELLGHVLPSGDVARVLDRALEALITQLEKRKFAAASQSRPSGRPSTNPRHIPAHIKRAVWDRDGGQCTFVSESGRRCEARTRLEFDHVQEVARGGRATPAGIRLRCRAHNQYQAERTFGAAFMQRKREEARRELETTRQEGQARALARERAQEVIPWLRALGFRADEARRAATRCEGIPDAPLEQRVRVALACFGPRASSARFAPT